jgi:hypothetical protein
MRVFFSTIVAADLTRGRQSLSDRACRTERVGPGVSDRVLRHGRGSDQDRAAQEKVLKWRSF